MPTSKKPTNKPADATPPTDDPSAIKDPATWTTGGEPMTGAQESYLHTLARQAGKEEELPGEITKSEASELIDELQVETGRGTAAPAKKGAKKQ